LAFFSLHIKKVITLKNAVNVNDFLFHIGVETEVKDQNAERNNFGLVPEEQLQR